MRKSVEGRFVNFEENNLKDYQIQLLDKIEISKPKHLKILCQKLREEHYYQSFIDEFMKDHNQITRDFYRLNRKKRTINTNKDDIINKSISYNSRNTSSKNTTAKNSKERQKGQILNKPNEKGDFLPKIDTNNQKFLHNQSIIPSMVSLPEAYTNIAVSQEKIELPSLSHYDNRPNTKQELSDITGDKDSVILLANKFPLTEIITKKNMLDTIEMKDDELKKISK